MGSTEVKEAIPTTSLLSVGMWVETPQATLPLLTAIETLKTIAKFLRSHLSFEERQALGEGAQRQMMGALRSLTLIGYYLVNFAKITGASTLELAEVREEIDRLRYHLEQEKAANANLIKEIDCSAKMLSEAREMIDRRNDKLERARRRIEVLERRRRPDKRPKTSDRERREEEGKPQEIVLRDPLLGQRLKQDLEALHSSRILKLKELLSEQILFNAGISPVSLERMDLSLLKVLGPKIPQKRKAEAMGSKSVCA
ncbi:hypothetical protein COCNU_scaffold019491G000020 [Cocos nucifera]|nr:hypothetical protein [Cocos nucifera]